MKAVQINAVPYGSTGRIMFQLADRVDADGGEALCAAGFTWQGCRRKDFVLTGGLLAKTAHMYLARLTGRIGCFSALPTAKLLRRIGEFQPDVIHLHNLHGWFIQLPMLFSWLKKHDIPVVWTLHDCWAFTGHCPHFAMAGCEKWKTGCGGCSQYRDYPRSWFDCSAAMWKKKKAWFTGVKDLTIVTPSQWLADRVGESFLKDYPVRVVHNGIDRSVFRPTDSGFREKHHCGDKFILLGVAFDWGARKGLDVFIELAKRLDGRYRIVLVGTNETVDRELPENIISIHRTQDQRELAEIYSAADLFVNPTREDNFPTVNLESLACGTPVLTFRTGGSPEAIDETCGAVVDCGDIDALEREISRIERERPFTREACVKRAAGFDAKERFEEYIRLYKAVMDKQK
ncbi:MAG: glycosyltransferase [Oscillospiraceae bacterium]|nr:glycosyltransferase [Oscillospiraceae bacterium]